jgi:hypothetical protein
LDVQEISSNITNQRSERMEARLERVEDGMHAILNLLQARHPVNNNQFAAAASIAAIEETKEERKEEEGKQG